MLKGFRYPVGPQEDEEHLTHIHSLHITGQGPQWDWADRDEELLNKCEETFRWQPIKQKTSYSLDNYT